MTPPKPHITRKTKTLEIPWEFKVAIAVEVLRKDPEAVYKLLDAHRDNALSDCDEYLGG